MLDPAKLKQVLYNYLSNALKFTPDGGRVWTRSTEGDAVRVEVEDTGIGIAPEDIGRLFVEFQQLDSGFAKHDFLTKPVEPETLLASLMARAARPDCGSRTRILPPPSSSTS